MSYETASARVCTLIESATPDTEPTRRFQRLRGKASTATETGVAANSAAFRKFEITPGASRRGTAVNGHGAKQIVHEWTITILYPDSADPSTFNTIESDLNLIRAVLEDFRGYAFTTSRLQNVRVGNVGRVKKDGTFQVLIAVTATYIGSH